MSAGTAVRGRRERVTRLGELAAGEEARARGRLQAASRLVSAVDRRRAEALQGAAGLAGPGVSLALRGHLCGAGARHLLALAGEKDQLVVEVDACRSDLAEAMTKVRSLERLVERIDRAADEQRRRREAADLQDLVAVRAAQAARAGHRPVVPDQAVARRAVPGRAVTIGGGP